MKKVLITGGSGTIGAAFIKEFYNLYHFISFSRNEKKQVALKRSFEQVELFMGSVEDKHELINTFIKVKPDIVIHAAALIHVLTGEKQPAQAVKINILGSLNVIEASRIANVPITVGISTDKVWGSNNVYGYTKIIMERLFLEADDEKNRFICCRLGNVAGSHGSVIPLWFRQAEEKKPLRLTDPHMNRFMFSPSDSAYLIQKAIEIIKIHRGGCIVVKKMKSISLLELTKHISDNVEVIGKRSGESLNETLISKEELPFTYEEDDYIVIKSQENLGKNTLKKELNSLDAEKMSEKEASLLIANARKYFNTTMLVAREY